MWWFQLSNCQHPIFQQLDILYFIVKHIHISILTLLSRSIPCTNWIMDELLAQHIKTHTEFYDKRLKSIIHKFYGHLHDFLTDTICLCFKVLVKCFRGLVPLDTRTCRFIDCVIFAKVMNVSSHFGWCILSTRH